MLGLKPNSLTYTSDYFDLIMKYCEDMIKAGDAYADDTDLEKLREMREARQESPNRNNCRLSTFLKLYLLSFLFDFLGRN